MKYASGSLAVVLVVGWFTASTASAQHWHAPRTIGAGEAGEEISPVIGATGNGTAIASWLHYEDPPDESGQLAPSLWTARFAADWAAPEKLEQDSSLDPPSFMMASPDGRASVFWYSQDPDFIEQTLFSTRTFDGTVWGEPTRLLEYIRFRGGLMPPTLASTRAGSALLIQTIDYGSFGVGTGSNRYDGVTWDAGQSIPTGWSRDSPKGAIDDAGNAFAIWEEDRIDFNGEPGPPPVYTVQVSRLDRAASSWDTPSILEDLQGGWYSARPQVAVRPDGQTGLATWMKHDRLRYSQFELGRGWSSARDLPIVTWVQRLTMDASGNALTIANSAETVRALRFETTTQAWIDLGHLAVVPQGAIAEIALASEPGGRAILAWTRTDGACRRVWVTLYAPCTGWATPVALEPDAQGDAAAPDVAIDEQGHAFAVWQQQTSGSRAQIHASHFD